ncbi:hypothetical protein BDV93DRAFT_509480 [Ceratobasidium sp. AG-I]|nr:hypothetical protein BDV93DRAFT_509480 [Ceratobasidium sp. AG-I]
MPPNAKQLVDDHLANSQPDPDARPVTPEPTTQSGVAPEHALYDTPPDGSQSAEFRSGRRKRRSTERGDRWAKDRTRAEQRRKKTNRSRKVNGARRTHERESQNPRSNGSSGAAPAVPDDEPARVQLNAGPLPEREQRGRTRRVRDISRSPTPGSTDHEFEGATLPPTGNTQFTFVYETLDHEGLVRYTKEKFGLDVRGCDTQTILAKVGVAEGQQASQVGPSRLPPSVNTLPGRPLQVGGGWHLGSAASQSAQSRGTKRGPDASATSSGSSKRQRVGEILVEDTATESETDDERFPAQDRRAVEQLLFRSGIGEQGLDSDRRPLPGTQPPPPSPNNAPPSRESTPTTVPETQASRSLGGNAQSHCGKSFTPASPVPPIPTLLSPPRGLVHARLRRQALVRYIGRTDRDAKAAGREEADQLAPTDDDEVPETDYGRTTEPRHGLAQEASTGPFAPSAAPQRTYRRDRTHLPPAPAESAPDDDVDQPRPPPGAGPSRPPGAGGESSRSRLPETRRTDPVGSARADMIDFNEACAQDEATSFVQSVTRQSERRARRAAPVSRPLHELLDDDEEELTQAEAFAKKKWPYPKSSSRGRVRKPKPLARDVSGVSRQMLIMAKLHFFAYALVQGIYQTQATFIRWAASVYYATWMMELPTTPYVQPPHEHLEIMVNSVATMRGKVKERVRPFTATTAGFQQRQMNQQVIQENLNRFNEIYLNNFHCRTYVPRSGHYENPEIAHCIAVALFHGPGSVGMLYPDYFTDMPLTVVAFALAIQFCIEEWSKGLHQNGDLGMAAMREKYESQLAGLKELEYSGAQLLQARAELAGLHQSEIRPDTPELDAEDEAQARADDDARAQVDDDAMTVEEINAQTFETGRQESLRLRAQEIAAREEIEVEYPESAVDDDDVDAESHSVTAHSRPPSPPPPEYDEEGRLTTRSKGKGRAN